MWYTAVEIIVFIVVAALVGLVVGWGVWGWALRPRPRGGLTPALDHGTLQAALAERTEERDDLRATVRQLTADVDRHRLEATTAQGLLARATADAKRAPVAPIAEPAAAPEPEPTA